MYEGEVRHEEEAKELTEKDLKEIQAKVIARLKELKAIKTSGEGALPDNVASFSFDNSKLYPDNEDQRWGDYFYITLKNGKNIRITIEHANTSIDQKTVPTLAFSYIEKEKVEDVFDNGTGEQGQVTRSLRIDNEYLVGDWKTMPKVNVLKAPTPPSAKILKMRQPSGLLAEKINAPVTSPQRYFRNRTRLSLGFSKGASELREGTATIYADTSTPNSRSKEYTPAKTKQMIEQFLQDTALSKTTN